MFSLKRQFGNTGEDRAVAMLKKSGYVVLERNFLRKWGEIDIVARGTDGIVHFIEVKTVSRETNKHSISRDTFMPEENVTREKIQKLERTINSWIALNTYEGDWQLDVIAVEINPKTNGEVIRHIEGVY